MLLVAMPGAPSSVLAPSRPGAPTSFLFLLASIFRSGKTKKTLWSEPLPGPTKLSFSGLQAAASFFVKKAFIAYMKRGTRRSSSHIPLRTTARV